MDLIKTYNLTQLHEIPEKLSFSEAKKVIKEQDDLDRFVSLADDLESLKRPRRKILTLKVLSGAEKVEI